jgi:hypothetical protein
MIDRGLSQVNSEQKFNVSETFSASVIREVTRLMAREDFITFSRRENFKSCAEFSVFGHQIVRVILLHVFINEFQIGANSL